MHDPLDRDRVDSVDRSGLTGRVARDTALASGVAGVQFLLLGIASQDLPPGAPGVAVLSAVLIVWQALPLVVRQFWPVPVFVAVLVPNTLYYAWGFPPSGLDLALAIALYTVAARCRRWVSLSACGSILLVCTCLWLFKVGPYWSNATLALFVYLLVFFSAAWAWGRYHRVKQQVRDAYVADLVSRTEQLERDREADRERAVLEEKRRIARELHDSLAHQLSVMVVLAGAARRVVRRDPEKAVESMLAVEEAGRVGLELMPNLIHAMRGPDQGPLQPQPVLADLDGLVERAQSAGLDVTVEREGETRSLPPGVELSAFRIVQEALTNCLKHARGAGVVVRLAYRPEELLVSVRDDGGASSPEGTPSGHGLIGMRERVSMFGGQLDSGPTGDGGFVVTAAFPVARGA